MKVYFCSNDSAEDRGAVLDRAAVGDDRQLLIAPAALGWYVLVQVEPGGKLSLLSVFEQTKLNDVWLLWSNETFDQEEKSLLTLPGHVRMQFSERGEEQVYLCQVSGSIAAQLASRTQFAPCAHEELLCWLREPLITVATASCTVGVRFQTIRKAA